MKGIPLRIEIGPKDLEKGQATLTKRYDGSKSSMPIEELEKEVPGLLNEIHEGMYQKALKFLNEHVYECLNYDEIKDVVGNQKGFAKMMVKSSLEGDIEKKMKEEFNATPRVMPFDQRPFQSKDSYTGEEGADTVVYFGRAY